MNPVKKHISKISAISAVLSPLAGSWEGGSAGAVFSRSRSSAWQASSGDAKRKGCIVCPASSEAWLSPGLGIWVHFFHLWRGVSMPGFFSKENYRRGETAVRRCSPPGHQHFPGMGKKNAWCYSQIPGHLPSFCFPGAIPSMCQAHNTTEPSLGPPKALVTHK